MSKTCCLLNSVLFLLKLWQELTVFKEPATISWIPPRHLSCFKADLSRSVSSLIRTRVCTEPMYLGHRYKSVRSFWFELDQFATVIPVLFFCLVQQHPSIKSKQSPVSSSPSSASIWNSSSKFSCEKSTSFPWPESKRSWERSAELCEVSLNKGGHSGQQCCVLLRNVCYTCKYGVQFACEVWLFPRKCRRSTPLFIFPQLLLPRTTESAISLHRQQKAFYF